MHTVHNLVHLDLKSENVFLSPGPVAKIGDFDAAMLAGTEVQRVRGTEAIHPPEFYAAGQECYVITPAADVWAVGMLAYTLLYGKYAWSSAAPGRDPRYSKFLETESLLQFTESDELKGLFARILDLNSTVSARKIASRVGNFEFMLVLIYILVNFTKVLDADMCAIPK